MSAFGAMAGWLTPFLQSCLIDPLKARIVIFWSLEENAQLLSGEAEALRCLKEDVHGRLQQLLCSLQLNSPSNEVDNWFSNARAFLDQSSAFAASFASRAPTCSFQFGCRSNYKLAKRALALREQAERLLSEGKEFIKDTDLLFTLTPDNILLDLRKNAASLSRKVKALRSLQRDLLARVNDILSQDARMKRSNRFNNWYANVEQLLRSSGTFSDSITNMEPLCNPLCFVPSSTSCGCSSVRELRGRAIELLEEARLLPEEGSGFTDDQLVIRIAYPAAEEIPIYIEVIGQEDEFCKTLDLITGDEAEIIGICGMGGIGKTTLLENIHNHLCRNPGDFDVIVWLSINKDMNIERIHGELRRKLGLVDKKVVDETHRYLNEKSFLVFMDDVWDRLELRKIGIPPLSSAGKRKAVLTTRFRDVCHAMQIREESTVSVGALAQEQAWRLFCLHVKNENIVYDPSIEALARDVANKCGGLPLALSVIGKAMAGSKHDYEWRNAQMELERAAYVFPGMDQVLSTLKFSLDRLQNDATREILLYCSLYPQGHNIFVEDLVEMLMEENLLDSITIVSRDHARVRLQTWISQIINAGLLLRHKEDCVKLHDCVRDMALWLTNGAFCKSKLFVRWSSDDSGKDFPRFLGHWKRATRTSVIYSELDRIPDDVPVPRCNELLTLLWEMGRLYCIPENFFLRMPHLRVLNLSNSGIKVLPKTIGRLISLKYLNLQSTQIESLPEEIGDLVQLVQLILRYTHYLRDIPCTGVSRLYNLVKLDMQGSYYFWKWIGYNGKLGLRDVEALTKRQLSDIGIRIKLEDDVAFSLPQSTELVNSITYLDLMQARSTSILDNPNFIETLSKRIQNLHVVAQCEVAFQSKFRRLQELSLSAAANVITRGNSAEIFPVLRDLQVSSCGIRRLTWAVRIPYLKVLRISNCDHLEMICEPTESEMADSPFPCLKELVMRHCEQLSEIAPSALLFPSLVKLEVFSCSALKKLPFGKQSAPKLEVIRGSNLWWDQLQWGDDSLRSRFLPLFAATN